MKLEETLRGLLKGEHSSLSLRFNEHANYYETAEQAINGDTYRMVEWVSPEEKAAAQAMNSVWTLQWYPHTPIGFHVIGASSLAAVIEAVSGE